MLRRKACAEWLGSFSPPCLEISSSGPSRSKLYLPIWFCYLVENRGVFSLLDTLCGVVHDYQSFTDKLESFGACHRVSSLIKVVPGNVMVHLTLYI